MPVKVYPLPEGRFVVNAQKEFTPYEEGMVVKNAIVVEVVPFLLTTETHRVLIDSGLGSYNDLSCSTLLADNLKTIGVSLGSIDIVLLSHLHKDHISGLFQKEADSDEFIPLFPNAVHVISRKEMEHACAHPEYYPEGLMRAMEQNLKIDFIDDSVVEYNDFIKIEHTGGHSPFHQVFYLGENYSEYFYGGDVLPQPEQALRRIRAKYDYNPELCADLRTQYAHRMAEQNTIGLFYHSCSTPMARYETDGDRITLKRID